MDITKFSTVHHAIHPDGSLAGGVIAGAGINVAIDADPAVTITVLAHALREQMLWLQGSLYRHPILEAAAEDLEKVCQRLDMYQQDRLHKGTAGTSQP